MKKHIVNHLGMAVFVFVALTTLFFWITGTLNFGSNVSGTVREGGREKEPISASPADGGHGHGHGLATAMEQADATDADGIENKECEHDIRQIDCDGCRFELGVVKVEPAVAKSLLATAAVEEGPVGTTVRLTGRVEQDPTRVVDVAAVGAGKVLRVRKFLGDRVAAGDALAVVHSGEFGEAKAAYIEAKGRYHLAERTVAREKGLYDKKISSEADYLDATRERDTAEAALTAADKRLRLFGLEDGPIAAIGTADDNGTFADLVLRSPRAGTVVAQAAAEGRVVEASQSLFTVADLSSLWVWCDLYERDLASLHDALDGGRKLPATVSVAAFPSETFAGVIDLIGNELDEQSRTIKVRVQVPNPGGKLKPGMFATVETSVASGRRAMLIPRDAVLVDGEKAFAFEHWRDDLWIRRDVVLGREQGQSVEVVSGLSPGSTIAQKGAFMLKSDVLREKMGAGCAD